MYYKHTRVEEIEIYRCDVCSAYITHTDKNVIRQGSVFDRELHICYDCIKKFSRVVNLLKCGVGYSFTDTCWKDGRNVITYYAAWKNRVA